ncbi:hypothetical protein AVU38_gp059 [Ralstonia phage RSL2]|nr:hypothetical protein AVU38_gp059 [Ralstonia phage RSL2]
MLMKKKTGFSQTSDTPTGVLVLAMDFETYPPKDLQTTSRTTGNYGGTLSSTTFINGSQSFYLGANGTAYVYAQTAGNLQFTGDFTIEYWLAGGQGTTGWQTALSKSGPSGTGVGNIGSNAGYPCFMDDTGSVVLKSTNLITTPVNWIHHCFTRKGNTLRYLRNGVPDTEVTWSGTWGNNTGSMLIGNSSNMANTTMNGYMDRLRMWQGWQYWNTFTPARGAYPS